MNDIEQKLKQFHDETGLSNDEEPLTPFHLSMMVITGYMKKLKDLGILLEGEIELTEQGVKSISILEKLEWKPTDEELSLYCNEMVQKEDVKAITLLLKVCRDTPDEIVNYKPKK